MVASHELTHAFDSSGRLYNQDGKLEEWWTNTTSDAFDKKQQCILDQYSGMLNISSGFWFANV
jgi:endothelin-converting enzyme